MGNAAPGGFPATTRTTSASSGLFTPYDHHDNGGESSLLNLPAGTELSSLTGGLGLDNGVTVTSSFFTPTPTYSTKSYRAHSSNKQSSNKYPQLEIIKQHQDDQSVSPS